MYISTVYFGFYHFYAQMRQQTVHCSGQYIVPYSASFTACTWLSLPYSSVNCSACCTVHYILLVKVIPLQILGCTIQYIFQNSSSCITYIPGRGRGQYIFSTVHCFTACTWLSSYLGELVASGRSYSSFQATLSTFSTTSSTLVQRQHTLALLQIFFYLIRLILLKFKFQLTIPQVYTMKRK